MISEKIKKIAALANGASSPATIMFGEVKGLTPLQIMVDNRFFIDDDFIIRLRDAVVAVGDKVVLIRNAGGQQFLLVGRL
ncbi:DUF2577 family protein [Paenibacillus sp. GCM10027627]|uniref:DUF2577 family protein n=1 Tax=unclassified Paenibacillus TaxID=185978 RepID=UPI00363FB47B